MDQLLGVNDGQSVTVTGTLAYDRQERIELGSFCTGGLALQQLDAGPGADPVLQRQATC